MKSIYGKLILGFLVSIIFSFSIAGYFSVKRNASELGQLAYDELNNSSDYIISLIKNIDDDNLEDALVGYANTSEVSFIIEKDNKAVKYGNINKQLVLDDQEEKNLHQSIGNSIVKSKSSIKQLSKSYEIDNHYYIISIQKDSLDRENIFLNSAIIAVFCVLIAGSFMFLVIADIIVKPISRLTKATNELSKGNYRVRVNYSGNDEIAALNRSFNQMAMQLAKAEEIRQQFISDISHEFQTPLTAIQGFATILKNENIDDEQRKKYADIILFQSKRLSTLSKNMLQLTVLENDDLQLDKKEYSLIEQFIRVINTQDNLALKKDIEIEFNRPKSDIIIEADEARLEQVWINLLNNAIKYTNEHGVVTIDIKKTNKDIEVSIADTGIGMSKEAISHIFERFYRNDKSRNIEGSGLGLSIVKKIIDLHEGTIDVVSQEDAGSVFTVKLPIERVNPLSKLNLTK
jgi:signal transduction histidine kinase